MKIIISCCLLLLISCQSAAIKKPKLEGLWCSGRKQCAYFTDSLSLFPRINFEPYKLQGDTLQPTFLTL